MTVEHPPAVWQGDRRLSVSVASVMKCEVGNVLKRADATKASLVVLHEKQWKLAGPLPRWKKKKTWMV